MVQKFKSECCCAMMAALSSGVLEGVNSNGDITLGFEASASEIYPLSEFNLKEWEIAAE